MACASGERLFFTDALCRLPFGRRAADLYLTAIPGFWIATLTAACDTAWLVDPTGGFRQNGTPAECLELLRLSQRPRLHLGHHRLPHARMHRASHL